MDNTLDRNHGLPSDAEVDAIADRVMPAPTLPAWQVRGLVGHILLMLRGGRRLGLSRADCWEQFEPVLHAASAAAGLTPEEAETFAAFSARLKSELFTGPEE